MLKGAASGGAGEGGGGANGGGEEECKCDSKIQPLARECQSRDSLLELHVSLGLGLKV